MLATVRPTRRERERQAANAAYLRGERGEYSGHMIASFLNDAAYWRRGVATRGVDLRVWREDGTLSWGECIGPGECATLARLCIEKARRYRARHGR